MSTGEEIKSETAAHLSQTIIESNREVTDRLIRSNELTADRLVKSDVCRQERLDQHYAEAKEIAAVRFNRQKHWSWTSIALNLLILLVLAGFALAFFKYAIVVTTR